jgi:predicted Rossmann fold nucleotide-binding protein DprA/Smf involved in DNA uptake
MKVAIVGSRNVSKEISLDFLPSMIISGGAIGIDTKAKEFALENNIELLEILPDYKRYGKSAPLVRNREIVSLCDSLIAYWDGLSRGTKFTIDAAKKLGKDVKIIYC